MKAASPTPAEPQGLDELLAEHTPATYLATIWSLVDKPVSKQAALALKEEGEGRDPLSPALLAGLAEVRENVVHAGTDEQHGRVSATGQALYSRMMALEAAFENHLRRPGELAHFLSRMTTTGQSRALCGFLGIELPEHPDAACTAQVRALVSSLAYAKEVTLDAVDKTLATLMPPAQPLPRVRPDLLVRWFVRLSAQVSDLEDRQFMGRAARELRRRPDDAQEIVATVRLYIRFALASASTDVAEKAATPAAD